MNITSKTVYTEVRVEITFPDFINALAELHDLKETPVCMIGTYHSQIWTKLKSIKDTNTVRFVKLQFECSFSDYSAMVIRYIAYKNGYEVSNYGHYDKLLNVRTALLKVMGSHI